ncbi:MAG: SDR family oxidoreductase [Acidimicrobiia bacterium]|nr:SDR family oxidoreductase [Acidimicrobiia bacterium]
MEPLFDISGRRAFISGGSRGIGLMIARGFVEAGARVIISSRNAEACEEAVAGLSEFGEASALPADVSTVEGINDVVNRLAAETDSLDILVNNAGAVWAGAFEEYPEAAWDKVMDLNLKSLFFMTQAVAPMLKAAATSDRPARVINIASIDGLHVPAFETYPYGASKAGVIHLTRQLAKHLAPHHVNVNAIAPGLFPSKMTEYIIDQYEDSLLRGIPRGSAGTAEDIAGTAIYLSARASNYVTGQTVVVDGGLTGTL